MAGPRNATTTNRGRTYRWKDESFDSVTTIISGGVPKPALKAWGERLVAETAVGKVGVWTQMGPDEAIDWLKRAPFRETDRAAVQGSNIHDWAEKRVLGQPLQVDEAPEAHRPYLRGFMDFLAQWKPDYEMTEATVYNRTCGYAGTLDFLAWLDIDHVMDQLLVPGEFLFAPNAAGKVLVLGDYKTGKGVYGEVALQLAAYRFAEFIGMPDGSEIPMPEVSACVVLHLTPSGFELIPVRADEVAFNFFRYAQMVRIFCEAESKKVLGRPLKSRSELGEPRPSAPANVAALVD
jgi:hypothetical protein